MTMKMTKRELQLLNHQVDGIERIDTMLQGMIERYPAYQQELGEKIKAVIGRNVIDKTPEWIGAIAFNGLVNALLAQRELLAQKVKDSVDVPASPYEPRGLSSGEDL